MKRGNKQTEALTVRLLPPGTRLANRYEIASFIGRGASSTVYRGVDLTLRREIAIKLLLPHYANQRNVLGRFLREARILASLDSPHVVPVYDFGRDGDNVFLVMKLLSAPTLYRRIEMHGPLDDRGILLLMDQVLEGLSHLHARGTVHRDVKTANIVVPDQGPVMLLDFGLALDVDHQGYTTPGTIIGTPHYMSPEQINTPGNIDGRSDLYAAGVVMFEGVTGRVPFQGQTPSEVCWKHANEAPPRPESIALKLTGAVSQIILRALEKAPEARFQTASEMRASVAKALADLRPTHPSTAPAPSVDPFLAPPPPQLALLIVDDDDVDRMAVYRAVTHGGLDARIDEATSARGALDLLRSRAYDCAILDLSLPDQSAIAILRTLAAEGLERTPVVVLTGLDDEGIGLEAVKAGAQDFLVKGTISPEALARAVRYAIERHAYRRVRRVH